MAKRYLKIREPSGREIIAWMEFDPQPILPIQNQNKKEEKQQPSTLMFLSLMGWGVLGIFLGTVIFY